MLLASPALLVALAGQVLLVLTPCTWGVAAHVGMPDYGRGLILPACDCDLHWFTVTEKAS